MKNVYFSSDKEETQAIAAEFAGSLQRGDTVALYGGLGAGKTVFAGGILKGLGYTGITGSPTFTVVNEYDLDGYRVAHFDMYRIPDTDTDILETAGFYDYEQEKAIIIIEWSEKIEYALTHNTKRIYIEGSGEDIRRITITAEDKDEAVCS